MYIDNQAICDYWFNIQKEVAKQFNLLKIVDDPRYKSG
jgi:hypothetical protein